MAHPSIAIRFSVSLAMHSNENIQGNNNSRCPKDSSFFQQKLPAWHPRFIAGRSSIAFVIVGTLLLVLGAVTLVTSNSVIEYAHDYTDCNGEDNNKCADSALNQTPCVCNEQIAVTSNFPVGIF